MAIKSVALICGGVSPEHEISVRSAKNILNAIDKSLYEVHLIGISKSGKWYRLHESSLDQSIADDGEEISILPGSRDCFMVSGKSVGAIDVIFPILHGPNGEDGAIQGLIQMLKLPCVGPGVLGSSISMDKEVSKRLLKHQGIGVADWITLRRGKATQDFDEVRAALGDVVFIKPANMGSSVGVSRVTNEEEWIVGIEEAFKYDSKILVEARLIGRELECAVLGNDNPSASGVGEVISGDIYTYEEKYADSSSAQTIIPAEVSSEDLKILKETAISAYQALECRGLSRVDMFLTEDGGVWVNEINTMPGFTSISMYPKLWLHEGKSYSALITSLIELAVESHG